MYSVGKVGFCVLITEERKNESEKLTDNDLRRMMRDPKYWRDHDAEYVRKIENGFKKLYS